MSSHLLARVAVVVVTCAAALPLGVGIASAHITVDPDQVAPSDSTQLTFRVPNESRTASTVKVQLTFPTDVPLTSVRTAVMPGWMAEVIKEKIDPPIRSANVTITEAVRTIIWTTQPGNGVAPGQYGLFQVLTGALPDTGAVLVIPQPKPTAMARWCSGTNPQVQTVPNPSIPLLSSRSAT